MAGAIFYAFGCRNGREADTNRLEELIHKASNVVDVEFECLTDAVQVSHSTGQSYSPQSAGQSHEDFQQKTQSIREEEIIAIHGHHFYISYLYCLTLEYLFYDMTYAA